MVQDISASIDACAAHYGDDAEEVRRYLIDGQARALALPNRGSLKYDDTGNIHPDILSAYADYGFYIFENAISAEELADLQSDMDDMRARFPIHMGADLDAAGRPALGTKNKAMALLFIWRGPCNFRPPACVSTRIPDCLKWLRP